MTNYPFIYQQMIEDPRYLKNVEWGFPRGGHPEGAIKHHIAELEANLSRFQAKLSEEEIWKLKILIHVHDTFKGDARTGVAISHPSSHASLAANFLREFCQEEDLIQMVQWHDEPYALWKKFRHGKRIPTTRLQALIKNIQDWNLFLTFLIIDNCTAGKSREPLRWFLEIIPSHIETHLTAADLLS
ncbi:Hypothetical protein PBC10988_24480 [Planctomycetales bacterium 10988]|nr:Hypothetical protein PBC10988_24480 [Planctomycetales bacterium 10988]